MPQIQDRPTVEFGLQVQPMVHVADLAASLDIYRALGGELVFGSRDGDWALIRFSGTFLSLLAHPPSNENPAPVELQFVSAQPLDLVEAHLQATHPGLIERGVADEGFGRMLKLRTPDGLQIKLLELQRDLIA